MVKKTSQVFLKNILAFQMPGTFILARQPISLNIVRNSVLSKAGVQIPVQISAIQICWNELSENTVHCNAVNRVAERADMARNR